MEVDPCTLSAQLHTEGERSLFVLFLGGREGCLRQEANSVANTDDFLPPGGLLKFHEKAHKSLPPENTGLHTFITGKKISKEQIYHFKRGHKVIDCSKATRSMTVARPQGH